jgi:phage regulator Rha-like protein
MAHCAGRSHDKMKNLIEESTPQDKEDGGNQNTLHGMSTKGMVILENFETD